MAGTNRPEPADPVSDPTEEATPEVSAQQVEPTVVHETAAPIVPEAGPGEGGQPVTATAKPSRAEAGSAVLDKGQPGVGDRILAIVVSPRRPAAWRGRHQAVGPAMGCGVTTKIRPYINKVP